MGNITGLSHETFENLQVDAGAAFKNLGVTEATTAAEFKELLETAKDNTEKRIGATEGGFSFEAAQTYRKPTIDGLSENNVKGLQVPTGVNVHMSFTSKEITAENFGLAMGNAVVERDDAKGRTLITPRFALTEESYVPELCFIGSMASGKQIVCIQLMDVLNADGTSFTATDNGEGSLTFDMIAHMQDPWDVSPPYRIYYFDTKDETDVSEN